MKPLAAKLEPNRALVVSEHEYRAIVSGLRRLRANTLGLMRRDERQGWRPQPGKEDTQKLRLATIDGLLARLDGKRTTTRS